ncbi:MAG: DinB family protein, partial [Thermomicrobiales bacterium]
MADLFRHNLWANLTLIDFCMAQPHEVLDTNVLGTFGSIRDTLGHLAGVEEGYLRALVGGEETEPDLVSLRERALAAGEVLDLAAVREHARASGERMVAYAETVDGNPTVLVTV